MNTMKNTMATERQKMRREAEQRLAAEVGELLQHNEQEGLHWSGTSIDLMEALHVAYATGELTDEMGICLSFSTIVRHACLVLHTPMPRNPYETASRGSRRKGRLMNTYMDRYQLRLSKGGRALWSQIEE